MGCDIHIFRERKIDERWTSLETWEKADPEDDSRGRNVDYASQREYRGHNYDLFGALCEGVRREFSFSFAERGVPQECARETAEVIESWGGDGHSHSYLYLHELRDFAAFLASHTMPISGMMDRNQKAKIQSALDDGREVDWDWLYPYCQGTNDSRQVDFKFDVPASFGIGESLQKIIDSFDGIEGAPHELRMVFFFDN